MCGTCSPIERPYKLEQSHSDVYHSGLHAAVSQKLWIQYPIISNESGTDPSVYLLLYCLHREYNLPFI